MAQNMQNSGIIKGYDYVKIARFLTFLYVPLFFQSEMQYIST